MVFDKHLLDTMFQLFQSLLALPWQLVVLAEDERELGEKSAKGGIEVCNMRLVT